MLRRPMNPKVQLAISIGIILGVVIFTIQMFRHPERFGPFAVSALVITLAAFLLLLLLRHFLLVWFSYLHQRELSGGEK